MSSFQEEGVEEDDREGEIRASFSKSL
jgi:hypothetical protein